MFMCVSKQTLVAHAPRHRTQIASDRVYIPLDRRVAFVVSNLKCDRADGSVTWRRRGDREEEMVRVDAAGAAGTAASAAPHHDAMYYGDAYYHPTAADHYYPPPPDMCPGHPQMCTLQSDYGPVTVPMVSTNSNQPMVPVQVPPGHVVQQILDETGTLRHVILSPQPPGPHHLPPHMQHGPPPPPQHYAPANGGNGPQQYFPPPGYPPPHFHPHGPQMQPPPQHPSHRMPHSPPQSYHKDERAHRQFVKLRKKIEQRFNRNDGLGINSTHSTPSPSPRKEFTNGVRAKGPGSVVGGTSSEGEGSSSAATSVHGDEEESHPLLEYLSSLQTPQVSDVTSRSALVQWNVPSPIEGTPVPQFNGEIIYELLLGEKDRYKAIYSGTALSCRVQDLRPGTEYSVCVQALVGDFSGSASSTAVVRTPACEPYAPVGLRLSSRTKSSLLLRWTAPNDNGAHIQNYILQYDEGKGGDFVDLCKTRNKQHTLQKLEGSTRYRFRLAAVNEVGRSPWGDEVVFATCGSPPPQPSPPILIRSATTTLLLQWLRRPGDEDFALQMQNENDNKHGYLAMYDGRDTEYVCDGLFRYTDYKFRLQAKNEEGGSRWSDEVVFRTLPERPGPPTKPYVKGKIHAYSFRVRWEPPGDRGGTDIQEYTLQIDDGNGFEKTYTGADQETTCDRLLPGSAYHVRVSCKTSGGTSNWSDVQTVTTEAVVPGPCQPPILTSEPKPYSLSIKWQKPDYDGGSPVLEYNVELCEDINSRLVYKGKETDCTVLALLPGTRYSLRVKAFNRVGGGAWSEALHVTSGAASPETPNLPRAFAKSPFNIVVQWDEPVCNGGQITDYQLEMSSSNRDDASFTPIFQGTQLSHDVKNLTPFTSYYFKICASNKAGTSKWSDVCEAATPGAVPAAPPSVTVVATATDAQLTWVQPPCNGYPILHYRIDIGERVIVTQEPILEHLLENLQPESVYKVRIQAVNEIGIGNFSPTLKLETLPPPPSPPAITCLQQGHNFLKLKWGEGKNIDFTQYIVEMQSPRRKEYQIVYQGTSLSFRVKKLQESTKYKFRICASNDAGGQGDFSEDYEFETTPAPPATLKVPRQVEITLHSLQIEWASTKIISDEPLTYIVQCCRTKDQEYKQVYRGSETTTTIEGLESGCEYSLRVCAEREVNGTILHGAWSPALLASIPAAPTVAPVPSAPVPRRSSRRPVASFPITDNHYALLIIFGICFIAIIAANGIKKFIDSHDSV